MSLITGMYRFGSAAVLSAAMAGGTHAAMVTLEGDNVRFTYDDSTLYGAASVVGDALVFAPTEFAAESLNWSGLDTSHESINIRVELKDSFNGSITGLQLMEQGDYEIDGLRARVDVDGRLQVNSRTTLNGLLPYTLSSQFDAGTLGVDDELTGWEVSTLLSLSDAAGWAGAVIPTSMYSCRIRWRPWPAGGVPRLSRKRPSSAWGWR